MGSEFAMERRDFLRLGFIAAIPYRALVPDIALYFPTEEDLRILAATSFGSTSWHF